MLNKLTAILDTSYQELLRRHHLRPKPLHIGACLKIQRDGATHWIVRRRAGEKIVDKYLGPDTPQTRETVEQIKQANEELKAWRRGASEVSSLLKGAKCLAPDMNTGRIFAALSEAGFFRNGGLLGGTHAFRLYPLMLGYKAPEGVEYTEDIDLLASRSMKFHSSTGGNAIAALQERGLKVEPVLPAPGEQVCSWTVGGTTEIEILTTRSRNQKPMAQLKGLGVSAQALKFLEFSLNDPVEAVALYREGVLLQVPAPERFALHKLIVSQVRSGSFREKRRKDLRQAAWLIKALLESDPYRMVTCWEALLVKGPKWRKLASDGLNEIPQERDLLLEALDQY